MVNDEMVEQGKIGIRGGDDGLREAVKQRATWGQLSLVFGIALVILVLDQVTKQSIESWLPLNRSWAPWPEYAHLFQFSHVANTGAAFGLLPNGSWLFGIAAIIVAGVIVVYNFQLPAGFLGLRVALGLQLGGALGNFVDRVRIGHVTDFLDFGPWYIFNVADIGVVSGVCVLGYLMWQEERHLRQIEAAMKAKSIQVGERDALAVINKVDRVAGGMVMERISAQAKEPTDKLSAIDTNEEFYE